MNFQTFVEQVNAPCAVLSVKKAEDGSCGEIRVVSRNDAMARIMGNLLLPEMPYCLPDERNMRFEEFCFRAAIRGQSIHDYSHFSAQSGWGEISLIPLGMKNDGPGYCQFVFEPTEQKDVRHMAKVSPEAGAAIIRTCITLMGVENFQSRVEDVLRDMLENTGAWCCRIVLADADKKTVVNYCECFRPELPIGEKRFEIIRDWNETAGLTQTVIVTNTAELQVLQKNNPVWAARMQAYGLDSLLLVPLRADHTTVGFLYMVNFDGERVVKIKEIVELTGFFLGTQISNRLLMGRLEEMSYTDGLTGLNNRYAMVRRLRKLRSEGCSNNFGVVNLDLNGLKAVNDTEGHAAGDQLLVRTAEMLVKVFYREDLFRTGGDEFVIISTGIDEETFNRKLRRLRAAVKKDGKISVAVGAFWSDGSADFSKAFHAADADMYADKEAFYAAHPELRR